MHSPAELVDPFKAHLLQHLPVSSLVQLRSSCQAFRGLVDSGTINTKHNVANIWIWYQNFFSLIWICLQLEGASSSTNPDVLIDCHF